MSDNKTNVGIRRRQLLTWSMPTVAVITIPVHAQTTLCSCNGPPILSVSTPSKCAGNPPVGTAVIQIRGPDNTCDMIIESMEMSTDDDKSSLEGLPSFPFTVSSIKSETISWIGPASDAVTCLPLGDIAITIEYLCEDGVVRSQTYDLTKLLAEAVL